MSYADIASKLSGIFGRNFRHVNLDIDQLAERYHADGLDKDYAQTLASMDKWIEDGNEDRVTDGVLTLKVARYFGGIDARFADPATVFSLTGCVSGCVMPMCLHDKIPVIADFEVLERTNVWFNSGLLDHSIRMRTADWVAFARPRLDAIAERAPLLTDA
ncbi:hypothetical protein ATO67_21820 [Agrobacterium bohemicum]|uniref:YbaK/aminoacyl-tRNA synthetase-associated domain-containing protein n=1 Tax=Agrobacterium bohemicum TaxID=2052828 RepID=A0A135P6K7_9HYPH|nr:hypothetical protein ATO67_21820 [Agrobacterium bohemicum]